MKLVAPRKAHGARVLAGAASAGLLLLAAGAAAQSLTGGPDPKAQAEIEYAAALNEMGLPDYAKIVLDRISTASPEAQVLMKTIRLQALISRAAWEEVGRIIAREPDQDSQAVWAMKLAMADGYYAWGKYPEARGLYESFFKRYPDGPPESLNSFYLESAYKYAQMLVLMNQLPAAVEAYRNVTKARLERHVRRQVICEMAELMVRIAEKTEDAAQRKKLLEGVRKICDEILWVQDLWFGKAIVMMAHMRLLEGDVEGASKLIDDYRTQLEQLDATLRQQEQESGEPLTRLSPMAQCRYLLGVMMQDEAEKLLEQDVNANRDRIADLLAGPKTPGSDKRAPGALTHLLNVFIGYPGTSWAADAGMRARRVEAILRGEPFAAKIRTNVTDEQMAQVEQFQFQNARAFFNNRQFDKAVQGYTDVLNLFPETEGSVAALGELSRCYVELEDELYADMVVGHLAERFCKHPEFSNRAGDQVLRTAMAYAERNWSERKDAVEQAFFTHFPKHPSAPALMFGAAERRFAREDIAGALAYYEQIRDTYPDMPIWFDAMNRIAACYNKLGKHEQEITTLAALIQKLEADRNPGHRLVNARYREAIAYKMLDPKYIPSAFNRFLKLGQLLADPKERQKYAANAKEEEATLKILEGTLYNKAACYVQLPPPAGQPDSYRKLQAVQTLEELVKTFPKSEFAPSALSQIGTLWTILEKPDEAQEALRRLQKDYPGTVEAQNALFMLGMNLLQMGRRTQAVAVFKEMFSGGQGKYTPRQILTAGSELLKAKEYEIALEAFDRVLATAEDRALREPAMLGRGQVLVERKRFAAGAEMLETLLKEYPRSGFTVEASMYLSRAYGELGTNEADETARVKIFNAAIEAMNRARKFDQTKPGRARLDIELGRVLALRAAAEGKFGTAARVTAYRDEAIATYQQVILLADPTDPGVRPWIEQAYVECMPLMLDSERYQNVADDCDTYVASYPDGRFVSEMRSFRGKARVKLASTGQVATGGTTGAAETNEQESTGPGPGAAGGAGGTNAPAP